jgi:hypothetical protein
MIGPDSRVYRVHVKVSVWTSYDVSVDDDVPHDQAQALASRTAKHFAKTDHGYYAQVDVREIELRTPVREPESGPDQGAG